MPAHARCFDILVSDIGLPDRSGIDLIRAVRTDLGNQVPAVALTGFGMEERACRKNDQPRQSGAGR